MEKSSSRQLQQYTIDLILCSLESCRYFHKLHIRSICDKQLCSINILNIHNSRAANPTTPGTVYDVLCILRFR